MDRLADELKAREAISRAWQCVYHQTRECTVQGINGRYANLFFVEEQEPRTPPRDIDTCATALAISSLKSGKEPLSEQEKKRIGELCTVLLALREEGGGWASIAPLAEGSIIEKMVCLINDTTFALHALIDLGFPEMSDNIFRLERRKQLEILEESVQWLKKNRLDGAWYYSEIAYIESLDHISGAILPTSNTIIVLDRIRRHLIKFSEKVEKSALKDKALLLAEEIKPIQNEAIEWLRSAQNQNDGGYGLFPNTETKITNTALALRALLTGNDTETKRVAFRVLKRLLLVKESQLRNVEDDDIFEDYHQFFLYRKNSERELRWKIISHEKFLEGLLLDALIETGKKAWTSANTQYVLLANLSFFEKRRYRNLIKLVTKCLLERQKTVAPLAGAFRGRRKIPKAYPIYIVHDSMSALRSLKALDSSLLLSSLSRRHLVAGIGILLLLLPAIAILYGISLLGFEWSEEVFLGIVSQLIYAGLVTVSWKLYDKYIREPTPKQHSQEAA